MCCDVYAALFKTPCLAAAHPHRAVARHRVAVLPLAASRAAVHPHQAVAHPRVVSRVVARRPVVHPHRVVVRLPGAIRVAVRLHPVAAPAARLGVVLQAAVHRRRVAGRPHPVAVPPEVVERQD